ncbi:MAG: LD-carboxypeptidase [Alphaproteobacteria bacterium]|nr:LD-carboxypeptidase [Alphaproteobacteria bacterium]
MTPSSSFLSFPPPLKPKGTVGIVAPGRWPDPSWIDKPKAFLESRGYQVVVHAQNYLKEGQLAGNDAARAEAIMDMFVDTTVDAVLCALGGTGSLRLLDKLDYEIIQKQPKPFVGFSDVTVLLHAISRQCGFVTYHGPMGWNFAQPGIDPRTGSDLLNVIGYRRKHCRLHYPEVDVVRPGRADGMLTGGNITLLQQLIGTPFDWPSNNAILFIEDVDEPFYKIDRALNHLRLAGKFQNVQAVLVGEMVDVVDSETGFAREGERPYGRDLREIVLEHVPPGIPLGFNFPCGHGNYITTLPVGAAAQLTLGARGAELVYTAPVQG